MSRVEDDQLKDGERELLALADEHLRAVVGSTSSRRRRQPIA